MISRLTLSYWLTVLLVVVFCSAHACAAADVPAVVPIRLQLTAPTGLPKAGVPVMFSVEGAPPLGKPDMFGVSDADGVVRVSFPLSWFPSGSTNRVIRAALGQGPIGHTPVPAGVTLLLKPQLDVLFAVNDPLVLIPGPFVAGTEVSASATLVAGASATLQPTNLQRSTAQLMRLHDGTYLYVASNDRGNWSVAQLPRAASVPLLIKDTRVSQMVVADLSSDTAALGTLDFARPTGDSRLKVQFTNVPTVVKSPWVYVFHVPTSKAILLNVFSPNTIASYGPADTNGIDLPPGEVVLAVGSGTPSLWKLLNMRRLSQTVDPLLVPSHTLVSGQTTDLTIDWTDARAKFHQAVAVEPDPLPVPRPTP